MRKSDAQDTTHFRSGDRVFCMNGSWFYQTREADHGPFPTRDAALVDLKRYIDEMAFFEEATPADAPPPESQAGPGYADFTLVDKDTP